MGPGSRPARGILLLSLSMLLLPAAARGQSDRRLVTADRLLQFERYDEAARLAEDVLADDPEDPAAHYVLGRRALFHEEYDRAAERFERASALAPRRAVYRTWLGRAYLEMTQTANLLSKLGMARKTRRTFEEAVALDPDATEARKWLALFLWSAPGIAGGDKDAARRHVAAIARRDAGLAHRLQGTFHWGEEAYEAAIREYEAAVRVDPGVMDDHYQLGRLHTETRRYDRAIEEFEKALAIEPAQHVRYQLGRVAAMSGRSLERGREALDAYLANDPPPSRDWRAAAHWRRGQIQEAMGDVDRARSDYRAALRNDPDHDEARKSLRSLDERGAS